MNNVLLIGNLARDVELRMTKTGKKVATYTVAATTLGQAEDGTATEYTAFVNCVAWGKLADAVEEGRKGERVITTGRINTRSYEDNQGNKKYVTEVIAEFANVIGKQPTQSNFEGFGNDGNLPF